MLVTRSQIEFFGGFFEEDLEIGSRIWLRNQRKKENILISTGDQKRSMGLEGTSVQSNMWGPSGPY